MRGVARAAADRRLLGDLLIEAGVVGRTGLLAGLEEQRLRGGRLGYTLLKIGAVIPASLHLFLRDAGEVLAPDLAEALATAPAVDRIPGRLAHYYEMVPARAEGGVLEVALAAADTPRLVPALQELTGLRVDPIVCPPGLIAETLARFYPSEIEPGVLYRPAGDHLFVVSDRRRGLRPMLPEMLRADVRPADWLRSLTVEAIRRGARSLRLSPRRAALEAVFRGAGGEESGLEVPRGAYAGLARLLEGLTRLGARRRSIPREGRCALRLDGRELVLSLRILPALEGSEYHLDLRALRVRLPQPKEVALDLPGLPRFLERVATERRGLILVAGAGERDAAAGLDLLLGLLGDRLPSRLVPGGNGARLEPDFLPGAGEEEVPFEVAVRRAAERAPDLILLDLAERPERAAAAHAQARDRVVVACLRSADACAAAEWLWRVAPPGAAAGETGPAGILGVRLLERLCGECRKECDVSEMLPPRLRRLLGGGVTSFAYGCAACRGAGIVEFEPALEFLPSDSPSAGPGTAVAGSLRRERALRGDPTLVTAALHKALAGTTDVREALRLLHEQA